MSSVVVEPSGKSGQLYFAFAETGLEPIQDAGLGLIASSVATPLAGGADPSVATPAVAVADGASCHRGEDKVADVRAVRQIQQRKRKSGDCDPASAHERRLGKPVRIGAVMLDLLRSYGITEQEIADGLQNYATGERLCMP